MVDLKKYATNILLLGVTTFITGLQGFLYLPLFSKFFGASIYGVWSQISITILILSILGGLGLNTGVIKFLSGVKDEKEIAKDMSSILLVTGLFGLALAIVLFIFSSSVSYYLTQKVDYGLFFKFSAPLVILSILSSVHLSYFRMRQWIKTFCKFEITRAVAEVAIVAGLLFAGYGLVAVLLTHIIVRAILLVFKAYKSKISFTWPSMPRLKRYFLLCLPLILSPIMMRVIQTGDQFVIGFLMGSSFVGIYALAYNLSYIIRILVDPVYLIYYPALSRAWNQNKMQEFKTYFAYSIRYSFMIIIPSAFGLSMLATPILKLISTPEFLPGTQLMWLFSIGMVIFTMFMFSYYLLIIQKKTGRLFFLLLFFSVFNIVLNIFLIPIYGIYGAAIATFATFFVAFVIAVIIIKRSQLSLETKYLLKSVFSATVMSIIIKIMFSSLPFSSNINLLLVIAAGIIVYFASLFAVKGITMEEIRHIHKIVKRER